MGPRSGLWMKPMFDVITAKSNVQTNFNQGGLIERAVRISGGGKLVDSFIANNATGLGRAGIALAQWADSTALLMPLIVTGTDAAVNALDVQLARGAGIQPTAMPMLDPNTGEQLTATICGQQVPLYNSSLYLGTGEKELLKFMPFVMMSSYQPAQKGAWAEMRMAERDARSAGNIELADQIHQQRADLLAARAFQRGVSRYNDGAYSAAEINFQRAVNLSDGRNASLQYNLGLSQLRQGKAGEAA
jgi:TolA-binding protein